jgi:uncharacterized membrane protein
VKTLDVDVSSVANQLMERASIGVTRWFSEGNVPVKVGVIISLFGLAFLILEAVERGWLVFPIELRLVAVALFGLVLLVIGWRLRETRPVYALSVQGGGVATIYLTTFAAFALYDLLPAVPALGFMVAVTLAAGALAVLQDSRALAVLAIAGGFMAPVLTSANEGNHVVLFSYYAVLNAAVFGIAWFKAWRALNVLGFFFTFVIGTIWGYLAYNPADFATTEPFLVLFVMMYTVIPVLFANREEPNLKGWVDGTLVFGTPIVGFGLQTQLVGQSEFGLAVSAVALSAVYVGIATYLFRRKSPELRVLTESFWSLSIVFLAIAAPLALNARWTSVAWSLQGAAMIWLGMRQNRKLALAAGLILQLGAATAYVLQAGSGQEDVPLLNGQFLGAVLIAIAGLFSSWAYDRLAFSERRQSYSTGAWLLLAWGSAWWLGAGLLEIIRFLPASSHLGASLILTAGTIWIALFLAGRFNWQKLESLGFLMVSAMAIAFLIGISDELHPGEGIGWLAWPVAFATHFAFLRRCESRFPTITNPAHALAYWLLIGVLVAEAYWWLDRWTDGIWAASGALALAGGLILLTISSRHRLRWPLDAHWQNYVVLCMGIGVAVLGWTVVVLNLLSSGNPAPLVYVPLVNPLELVSAFTALVIGSWYTVARQYPPFDTVGIGRSIALLAGAGLYFLTMAVSRAVHHWGGVPFDPASLAASNVLQASLSIVWGGAALGGMIFGARYGRRLVWMAGAGLMTVVVVKLFLVELGNTGTVTRVVSFLGVGILLLIVGYFAPVPPREGAGESPKEPAG